MTTTAWTGWRRLLGGIILGVAATLAAGPAASAATTATFSAGVLSVFGDSGGNSIVVSRDAAGKILVNGGVITVLGRYADRGQHLADPGLRPGRQRVVSLNEANGALPTANLLATACCPCSATARGNSIAISRDAAGKILVNGGAIAVVGGTPTVANTSLIRVFGLGGADVVSLNEANGALPAANLFGGADNDTSPAAPAATSSSGRPATTRCSGRAATTSCSAAARTTSSRAATPTTRPSARAATTG